MPEPASPPNESGALVAAAPTLRRILTRFFGERAPAAFAVDALLMLFIHFGVNLLFGALVDNGYVQESVKQPFLNRLLGIGPLLGTLSNVTYYVMIGLFAWGCVRVIADARKSA